MGGGGGIVLFSAVQSQLRIRSTTAPSNNSIMYSTFAYAKKSAEASFEKITISRNEPGEDDVQFDVGRCTLSPKYSTIHCPQNNLNLLKKNRACHG